MPEQPTVGVPYRYIQTLDSDTLIMVTCVRATPSHEIKKMADEWFEKRGKKKPSAYRTAGYKNWYTPLELERIILEVKW